MKKLLFFTVLTFFVITAQAQVKIGIRAGLNSAKLNAFYQEDASGSLNDGNEFVGLSKPLISFHAGLTFDIPLSDQFSFQPSVLYSGKGSNSQYTVYYYNEQTGVNDYVNAKIKSTPFYIDLPLHFVYKNDLGAAKLLIGAGPYLSYGISGKTKADVTFINAKTTTSVEDNIAWSESDYNANDALEGINRFDAGLSVMLGMEFSEKFQVAVTYGFGLANTNPSYLDASSSYNRVLGISTAVFFGK
jgi:hypothetical protein